MIYRLKIYLTVISFLYLSIFFKSSTLAEIVTIKHKHFFGREVSPVQGCEFALNRSKIKAIQKVSGQKINLEEIENCLQIDGKTTCEKNKVFLSSLDGEIDGEVKILNKTEGFDQLLNSYYCSLEIEANVLPAVRNPDPNFDFSININKLNFRNGEDISFEVTPSVNMYFYIFQWHPYNKRSNQITKLFPNNLEKENFFKKQSLNNIPSSKSISYTVEFPESVEKLKIDEYLIIIGSKNRINFLDNYVFFSDLKKQLRKVKNSELKYSQKQYTILR